MKFKPGQEVRLTKPDGETPAGTRGVVGNPAYTNSELLRVFVEGTTKLYWWDGRWELAPPGMIDTRDYLESVASFSAAVD